MELIAAFEDQFNERLYKPLGSQDARDFDSLALCTNPTEGQRDNGLLILAKGIVDSLDVKTLRKVAGAAPNDPSLKCLQVLVENMGGDSELVDPLRLLQTLRSSGSAHVKGSKFDATLTVAGLASMPPDKQFEEIVNRATEALQGLTALFRSKTTEREEAATLD